MKERKLKKYRFWFKCPYHIKDRDMVTDDPYPIYLEEDYCKLGRFCRSGYSGYEHSEEGTYCDKCKLPINGKQMHEILMIEKEYKRLDKAEQSAMKKVKWIHHDGVKSKSGNSIFDFGPYDEPDVNDPHYPAYEKASDDMFTFMKKYYGE